MKKIILIPYMTAFLMAAGMTGLTSSPVLAEQQLAQSSFDKKKMMKMKKKAAAAQKKKAMTAQKKRATMMKSCKTIKDGAKQKPAFLTLKRRKNSIK